VIEYGSGSRHDRRVWWFAALVTVPTALAAIALIWPGRQIAEEMRARPGSTATVSPSIAAPTAARPTPPDQDERGRVAAGIAELLGAQPILFGPDTADLPRRSAESVRRVAELLVSAPAVTVHVEGHVADTPGSPEVARRLSKRRAEAVADALVAGGVDRTRITTADVGGERPLATPELSRRVEISVR
jgi:outer membrane protein OmpA-like peptidoglycan-associated protein